MYKSFCRIRNLGLIIAIVSLSGFGVSSALAANGSVVYTYDALGRISAASYDTGVCLFYTYDAAGNRTAQTILVSGTGSNGVWGCFNWNNANWHS